MRQDRAGTRRLLTVLRRLSTLRRMQMAVRRRLESSRSTMEALREETATRIEMSRIEMHACAAA